MTSTAQAGHLYYVLRSRLDPSTYKPGITSSMGRRLRQHGGQKRWEVVGVYDLGSRKAYAIEQLILQRFDACRLNAAGEYLKLTDGQLEELLQIVSESTSKRHQPKTAEVKAPKPPAPEPAKPSAREQRQKEWEKAQELHREMQRENEREMWRARSPYSTATRKPAPSRDPDGKEFYAKKKEEETKQASSFRNGVVLLFLLVFGVPYLAAITEALRPQRVAPVAQPAPVETPKPVIGELAKPMVETPVVEPVKVELPGERWLAEKRASDQRLAKAREAYKEAYKQRILKEAEVAREWLKLNPACERNWQGSYGLCQQALSAVRKAVDLGAPQTISEDLARIKAQRAERAEPVVLQPLPAPVSLP